MSVWSLTYHQSAFKRYHSDKIYKSFYIQDGGKINWHIGPYKEQNYVTVCIVYNATTFVELSWQHFCDDRCVAKFPTFRFEDKVPEKSGLISVDTYNAVQDSVHWQFDKTSTCCVRHRQTHGHTAQKYGSITAENTEKSQHTDFNEDTTNESASVACSNIRL